VTDPVGIRPDDSAIPQSPMNGSVTHGRRAPGETPRHDDGTRGEAARDQTRAWDRVADLLLDLALAYDPGIIEPRAPDRG
jgi:hypothetical protein